MSSLLGVTVGHGPPYEALATLAAKCFTVASGVKAIVLSEADCLHIAGPVHPAAWRLWLFDLVEAENVVYFDADWFCLNDWDALAFTPSLSVLACQDFVGTSDWPLQDGDRGSFMQGGPTLSPPAINGELRHDYVRDVSGFAGLSMDPQRWINTGLMILNRMRHASWLEEARQLYCGRVGHHPEYFEQPSLLRAAQDHSVPLQYLPRTFNVLAAGRLRWPENVVGLHVKTKHYPEFASRVLSGEIRSPQDVKAYFTG